MRRTTLLVAILALAAPKLGAQSAAPGWISLSEPGEWANDQLLVLPASSRIRVVGQAFHPRGVERIRVAGQAAQVRAGAEVVDFEAVIVSAPDTDRIVIEVQGTSGEPVRRTFRIAVAAADGSRAPAAVAATPAPASPATPRATAPATASQAAAVPAAATPSSLALQGQLVGRQAGELRGTGGYFWWSLFSGAVAPVLGPIVALIVTTQKGVEIPLEHRVEAQQRGVEYGMGLEQGYSDRFKARRKSSSIKGGLLGTAIGIGALYALGMAEEGGGSYCIDYNYQTGICRQWGYSQMITVAVPVP
jgi:hypothetical protein